MESLTKKDHIWLKLMAFGHLLGCHQMESRSFKIHNYQFPLCARCTGVFLGEIVGIISALLGLRIPVYLVIVFIVIMCIDWGVQYFNIKMSTNFRRFITGTLAGFGLLYAYYYVFKYLFMLIIT